MGFGYAYDVADVAVGAADDGVVVVVVAVVADVVAAAPVAAAAAAGDVDARGASCSTAAVPESRKLVPGPGQMAEWDVDGMGATLVDSGLRAAAVHMMDGHCIAVQCSADSPDVLGDELRGRRGLSAVDRNPVSAANDLDHGDLGVYCTVVVVVVVVAAAPSGARTLADE